MAIAYNSSIVTSGLVLCVDAGNPRSYPGSGTQWNDATSSGFNFTLTNGPVYSSSNLGSFTFDGVNDFASASNNTALDTQTPTVEVWVRTNSLNQNGFWFEKGSVNSQYSLFQEGTAIQWRMNIGGITQLSTASSVISTSSWAQVVGTYVSGTRVLYVNGVAVNSDTQTGTIATNSSGMFIGAYGTGTGYWYNGALSICRVYNRALSAAEVLQNFNATRGRYGI